MPGMAVQSVPRPTPPRVPSKRRIAAAIKRIAKEQRPALRALAAFDRGERPIHSPQPMAIVNSMTALTRRLIDAPTFASWLRALQR